MKKIIVLITITLALLTACEDFLDKPPTTGLSDDKLTDLPSMQALVYGAYDDIRIFSHQSSLYAAGMVRDVLNRNRAEYDQFYDHAVSTVMTSWMYSSGYVGLSLLNTVAASNMQDMEGTDVEKNAILGDMHFLRALVYFDLNNYWALPSTGYSVPLLQKPIGVNDRYSCTKTEDVMNAIEEDIELARSYFENISGEADYYAATALAARIYFYHEKYDKAYERANEVILSNEYTIERNVAAPFAPGKSSGEHIFSFKYHAKDASLSSPTNRLFNAYRADETEGFYSLNPESTLAQLMLADKSDSRFGAFFTEQPPYTYIDGKYSTDQMDLVYIRLAEIHLTRAEANIMVNGSVSQQDVDDINILRQRANPSTVLASIPSREQALDIIFDERTKEMAIELGDHYLNVRRLKKGIIKTSQEGIGLKPYSEYSELLVFPFPVNEVNIHGLTRDP